MSEMGRNVLIVGAGVAGQLLARDIRRRTPHTVIGFIDDRRRTRVRTVGKIADLRNVVERFHVDDVMIAIPTADGALVRQVLLQLLDVRLPVRMVPREVHVLQQNAVRYSELQDLDTESWLGRPLKKSGIRRLQRFFVGKVVVVTGGAGSIGAEIVRQLLDLGAKKVVVYDSSEYLCYRLQQELMEEKVRKGRWQIVIGDVRDDAKVLRVLRRVRPDLVFHAAAYKHVHLMEDNADEAVSVNVLGTKVVLDAAREVGVGRFVFVSTDKAVNPSGVMGASKRVAEWYVQGVGGGKTQSNIVRFGNVINSSGSVLPLWERQVHERRLITITDSKMERFFMSIREAAQLVLTSATRASRGVYVLDMGDLIQLEEVAQCFIRSKNLLPGEDVVIETIGRRPGEKLKEELFSPGERRQMRRTSLSNIWQLRSQEVPVEVGAVLEDLEQRLGRGGSGSVKRYLISLFEATA